MNLEKTTARLEAFSDGIFGVAITLLALEIGIPKFEGATNLALFHKIIEEWPTYFTFFNSFATILLVWMGHHKIIARLRASNHPIMLLNGLVLLFVVLFPFPTKTVGSFIGTGAASLAVAFYASFTGVIVFCLFSLNSFIVKNQHLLVTPESLPWFHRMMKGQKLAILLYGIAAFCAFYSVSLALLITFGMWVYWAIIMKEENNEY